MDLWNLVGVLDGLRMSAIDLCWMTASPLAWRRPLSIPRTLRSLPRPNDDIVLMASLLEGQAHCSTVSDRNPPPPSFPRRACPVLDTGRESIPGMVRHHNPGSSPTRRPSILCHFVLTTPLIEHDAVQQSVIPALSRNPVPGGCTQTGWLWASRAPLSALIWRHHSELVLGGESRSDDRAGFKLAPTSHNLEVPHYGSLPVDLIVRPSNRVDFPTIPSPAKYEPMADTSPTPSRPLRSSLST